MKFLAVPAAFAVAFAQKKGAAPAAPLTTYTCPSGYTLEGTTCSMTETAAYITSSVPNTETVPASSFCPKGSTMNGGACTKTTSTARIASTSSIQVPTTSCPAGASGPGADGMCTTTRAIRVPTQETRAVPVTSTSFEKTPFSVPVSKQVSVPGAPTCPSGSSMEGGACLVTGSTTQYSTETVPTTLSFPVNTPVSSSVCPSGTTMAADGSCTATLSFQSVEQSGSTRAIRVATLASKPATYNLPSTTLRTGSTCPQGSSAQADGSCAVTLRTSSLEAYSVPASSQIPMISSVPQTLTLTKQVLVPSYSCPAGSSASGSGESMRCTIRLPTTSRVTEQKTVKKARFEKRPVTVTVSRVESVPVYYCPEGTVENSMGECTVTVTVSRPITVSETHTMCPAGSDEFGPGSAGAGSIGSSKGYSGCKRAVTATVPATMLPGTLGSKAGSYACPEGTATIGEGPSMTCATQTYEDIPMETYTTTSISYESSTVTETVPKLYRYETRTVTETATTEEVFTAYDDIVMEVESVRPTTYTEAVPALVSYSTATVSETVTVSNDRVDYVSCSAAGASSGSFFGGAGASGCLSETKYRVVTNSYLETVPAVATYFTEDGFETTTVQETEQVYETRSIPETSYSVATSYNTESVAPNTLVEYSTTYQPQSCSGSGSGFGFGSGSAGGFACTTRVVSSTVPMTETVSSIPSYTTQTVSETAHSERLSTVENKSTMTVQEMGFRMESTSETVAPITTYRTESSTSYSCPAGTVDSGSACVSTVSVAMESSCPAGTTASGAGCTRTTFTQVQSCPAGYTDTGSACVTIATVPATPVTMAAPAPTKYSAPTKHSRRHRHKHD
uniref:Uncharacterized protein n=1 Tax=Chromera velia CCMP2878 TaxID=1169474 RepID=A0A0G4IFI7_9ALVE|eukprot:Cvel_14055.t1-p1 / transcript=Cvel_14055.t1 / gene=Cvel_14055 / organism=Chromera_velia_CCMP2878 / gene_product=Flocculation protein FLO11, putative / transcript_product=Flocculation protein FLO11, putative / location=Cvel_scaffold986:382-3076(-) / protein_length=847 / sequence_SO=supercontig / SO=protein_coding / is_pseudo=false